MSEFKSFNQFKHEKINEHQINEAQQFREYDKATFDELQKLLLPLLRATNLEFNTNGGPLKGIRPDSFTGDVPTLNINVYQVITGGNWVSGHFFNLKDAEAAAKMFNSKEVRTCSSTVKAVVKKETFGENIYWANMKMLADSFGVKIDWAKVEEVAKAAFEAFNRTDYIDVFDPFDPKKYRGKGLKALSDLLRDVLDYGTTVGTKLFHEAFNKVGIAPNVIDSFNGRDWFEEMVKKTGLNDAKANIVIDALIASVNPKDLK